MADLEASIRILQAEFPTATIGLDNHRPYARMPDGTLFGILFGDAPHAGDPKWARGPVAIVRFPSGALSSRNWEIVKSLVPSRQDEGK
jgi:hypothetical protein